GDRSLRKVAAVPGQTLRALRDLLLEPLDFVGEIRHFLHRPSSDRPDAGPVTQAGGAGFDHRAYPRGTYVQRRTGGARSQSRYTVAVTDVRPGRPTPTLHRVATIALLATLAFLSLGAAFESHWQDGKAELDGYRYTVTRYGHARAGTAVMVYVTEPF